MTNTYQIMKKATLPASRRLMHTPSHISTVHITHVHVAEIGFHMQKDTGLHLGLSQRTTA